MSTVSKFSNCDFCARLSPSVQLDFLGCCFWQVDVKQRAKTSLSHSRVQYTAELAQHLVVGCWAGSLWRTSVQKGSLRCRKCCSRSMSSGLVWAEKPHSKVAVLLLFLFFFQEYGFALFVFLLVNIHSKIPCVFPLGRRFSSGFSFHSFLSKHSSCPSSSATSSMSSNLPLDVTSLIGAESSTCTAKSVAEFLVWSEKVWCLMDGGMKELNRCQ